MTRARSGHIDKTPNKSINSISNLKSYPTQQIFIFHLPLEAAAGAAASLPFDSDAIFFFSIVSKRKKQKLF
jgi:hypothetical protein